MIKVNSDKKLIIDLRKICDFVVGLETEETSTSKMSSAEMQIFCDTKRCTVANARWSELIRRYASPNHPNVVCCGAAHLVSVKESNKICESLAQHLGSMKLRIVSMAVGNSSTGMYKPTGSESGYLVAIKEIGEDEDEYASDDSDG